MAICLETYQKLSERVGMFYHDTNIGVVQTDDGIIVIDTGDSQEDGENLVKTLSLLFPNKKITTIINTHSHADHCGGNESIVSSQNAKVWTSFREAHLMELSGIMGDLYWGGIAISDVRKLSFENNVSLHADRIIDTRQGAVRLDLDKNVSARFIPLPGHYYDQMGVLIHDKIDHKRIFFLADGFFGASMLKKYWVPFMQNPELFRKSVEKIEHTKSDFYVPSHGDIYDSDSINAIAELNVIITYETEILVMKLLREQSLTQEELLKAFADFSGINLRLSQYVLIGYTLKSYLTSLHQAGLVTFELRDNKFYWVAVQGS